IDQVQASATDSQGRVRFIRLLSRVAMLAILAATGAAVVLATADAVQLDDLDSFQLLPLIETVINDVVYAGIAVFFLYSFPERLRRGQLLNLLFQLRSTAHIIDMHQLSKDPEQLRPTYIPTKVSRPLDLTRDEMERYLDYCSELLSLVGKAAALCAEESRDDVVLDTVSRIETLTVGLSRKIWQKISNLPPPGEAMPPAGRSPKPIEYPELRPPGG
ncbi:hypothetical protein, partial [Nocardioides sp.]|uniref:hypothetical protein n=1 Tax=Nocardioides sp. TaxID=35761 RepID=UPI001A25100F